MFFVFLHKNIQNTRQDVPKLSFNKVYPIVHSPAMGSVFPLYAQEHLKLSYYSLLGLLFFHNEEVFKKKRFYNNVKMTKFNDIF